MKYTAQQLKRSLIKNKPDIADMFKVNKYDRKHQIWKREPLSIELLNESMFKQKLEYIPVRTDSAGRAFQPCEGLLMHDT